MGSKKSPFNQKFDRQSITEDESSSFSDSEQKVHIYDLGDDNLKAFFYS